MSIVNSLGERIFLDPLPPSSRPVRSPAIRRRNRRWLDLKRRDDLTIRELAKILGQPAATVAAGVLWAEEAEDRREERVVAKLQSPVVCPVTGLTADDVLYLAIEYPPGTEIGNHPEFWAIIDPLLDKILGPKQDETAATSAEAA